MLPSEQEQEALLEALAGLVASCGHLPLVSSHLLEPSPRFFPDAWRPDEDGVAHVARRLLGYAGLGELEVAIEVAASVETVDESWESTPGGSSRSWSHRGALGWFLGIEDGRCLFGVDVGKLDDPEGLVGTMCHEVAHAFRHARGLRVEDQALEEQLTDVTTVFLGFGILTTNAAYRFRKSGELQGTMTVTRWSHDRAGYLSPEAMSFLLAAAVVARRLDGSKARRVERLLEPNQAGAFRAALKRLRRPEAGLARVLALPPAQRWPDPPPLDRLGRARALPDAAPGPAEAEPAGPPWNAGRPVFRVTHTRGAQYGVLGLLAGLACGLTVTRMGAGGGGVAACLAAGAVLGVILGRRARSFTCSDPACRAPLGVSATTCPRCGGDVSGDIARETDRLAAEELLRRRRGEAEPEPE